MIKVNIKPLSVNKAWKGRKFKTKDYKFFEIKMFQELPKRVEIPKDKIQLNITYGFSSKGSDLDNPTKMILDILSKKYKFNDNRVYGLFQRKEIVKKGNEYIEFEFKDYQDKW